MKLLNIGSRIEQKLKTSKISKDTDIIKVFNDYFPMISEEACEIFNYLFEYRNDDFEKVSLDWFEENVSIREFKEVLETVAEQSQIKGLLPFFLQEMGTVFKTMVINRLSQSVS